MENILFPNDAPQLLDFLLTFGPAIFRSMWVFGAYGGWTFLSIMLASSTLPMH